MAAVYTEQKQTITPSACTSQLQTLIISIMSRRSTWAFLFVFVMTILLSSSWNLLKCVLSCYESSVSNSSESHVWPPIYASMALGLIFGLLAMLAALVVVVPEFFMVWITVLVLLNFCGKPRKALVTQGKKLTGEITCVVLKVLIREGKFVAAVCAVLGYFALLINF